MRLIDADLLLEKRFENGMIDGNELLVPYNDVVNAIRQAPTVDEVEVVRCKDCKYSFIGRDKKLKCEILYPSLSWVENDGYCSEGERRPPNEKDNIRDFSR